MLLLCVCNFFKLVSTTLVTIYLPHPHTIGFDCVILVFILQVSSTQSVAIFASKFDSTSPWLNFQVNDPWTLATSLIISGMSLNCRQHYLNICTILSWVCHDGTLLLFWHAELGRHFAWMSMIWHFTKHGSWIVMLSKDWCFVLHDFRLFIHLYQGLFFWILYLGNVAHLSTANANPLWLHVWRRL